MDDITKWKGVESSLCVVFSFPFLSFAVFISQSELEFLKDLDSLKDYLKDYQFFNQENRTVSL